MRRMCRLQMAATPIVLLSLILLPTPARAAAGDLDSTFGNGGLVVTNIGGAQESNDVGNALALDTSGRIIVAGSTSLKYLQNRDFALVRYAKTGALDPTLGNGGLVTTDLGNGSDDVATGVVIDGNGRIVVAGFSDAHGSYDFALARYNPDGTLDRTFGSKGAVLTDFNHGSDDEALAVGLMPDGRIVVAGSTTADGEPDFALARYNPDGGLDSTFGSGGLVTTDFRNGSTDRGYALLIQRDGKIVAVGSTNYPDIAEIALARYNENGALDSTFGKRGLVVTAGPGAYPGPARAVVEQPDGMLVVAGSLFNQQGTEMLVVRYRPNGAIDQHFGTAGFGFPGYEVGEAEDLAIERDGKIIVAGEGFAGSRGFVVSRLNGDGTADHSFGDGGNVLTTFAGTMDATALAARIQSDGKLVAAGFTLTSTANSSDEDVAVARYDLGALGCVPDSTHICLAGSRFQVSVRWTNYNTGVSVLATAVPFRDESGFFYFQDPANIEVMVKMHNACKGYGHYWFFSAATTDVAYTITVTDTLTGLSETYSNPAHVLSEAKTDQSSFSCP